MDYMGQFAIAHIITHVFCICIAYWGLNAIRLDQFFKKGFPMQVQVIMIFAAILLGTSVSNFIIDLLHFSTQIRYLF
ncbi:MULTISPECIES: DUF1146 family protein [Staphylococcus]|uniref:DUF1146 domain-containing protein n=1 Tax=Staphylococcus schleiferi TaxID=1295 RepID=A0A7Z7VWU2_STASC|nr:MULTISPECIES: DUF1146 family protein [Staphylococcus]QGS47357.1 DUF1146 domain-containing protein [Mammaliicoccus fleurettii]EPD48213.1 hypothetical protein HMPREF1208_02263 [Staphylococcus sp. HGB0015]MBF1992950.1 DUF1146 domain-containing protein [Staphylococcus schleiferi]MBF2038422.1 DUF1146 domain-containing protein [Staphylococcus schleiferi]MBF2100367.1 DUF1146 domain-containing protein [Staphylococcus schleiferi]